MARKLRAEGYTYYDLAELFRDDRKKYAEKTERVQEESGGLEREEDC